MVPGSVGEGATAATPNMPEALLEFSENKLEQLKQKAHNSMQANKEKFLNYKDQFEKFKKDQAKK